MPKMMSQGGLTLAFHWLTRTLGGAKKIFMKLCYFADETYVGVY